MSFEAEVLSAVNALSLLLHRVIGAILLDLEIERRLAVRAVVHRLFKSFAAFDFFNGHDVKFKDCHAVLIGGICLSLRRNF